MRRAGYTFGESSSRGGRSVTDDEHQWAPLSPHEVAELLADLTVPWWIAGGWAIDLFLGRQTRPHADVDVLVRRADQLVLQRHLSDWDLHKTQQPGLKPWPAGEFLERPFDDIWCRRTPAEPWCLQLMLLDTVGQQWVFKRDTAIGGPLETIGRLAADGIPYLAPHIQLLYKAKPDTLAKDQSDFEATLPHLPPSARRWLLDCLTRRFPDGHPWIDRLRGA